MDARLADTVLLLLFPLLNGKLILPLKTQNLRTEQHYILRNNASLIAFPKKMFRHHVALCTDIDALTEQWRQQ